MMKYFSVLLIGILLLLLSITTFAEEPNLMSVQVKEAQLRSAPSFLGKVVVTVAYTTSVEVLEEKGDWMRVVPKESSVEGWMHASALTKKKILLKPGAEDIKRAATSDEVSLAGKGFNADVEEEFKEKNPGANYAAVDSMEKIVVSQQQMREFIHKGGITPEGGVQ